MVTVFCEELGWHNMALLFEQFQGRLMFGVQRELVELLRIQFLTARQARTLYNAGFANLARLATASYREIQTVLRDSVPFDRNCNDPLLQAKKSSTILFNGLAALSDLEAAQLVVSEAARLLAGDMAAQGLRFVPEVVVEANEVVAAKIEATQEGSGGLGHTGADLSEIQCSGMDVDVPLDAETEKAYEIACSQTLLVSPVTSLSQDFSR